MTVRTNVEPRQDPARFDDIAAELERAAQRWRDRTFVVIDGAQRISFLDLDDAATRLAATLRAAGVMPGDRVCLGLANSIEWVVAAFATWRVGAVVVPLSTRLVNRELRHCLDVAEPVAAIVHDRVRNRHLLSEWQALRDARIPVFIHHTDIHTDIEAPPADGTDRPAWQPPVLDPAAPQTSPFASAHSAECAARDVAAILFTSGTTAEPKGVMLTHRALLRVAHEVGLRQDLTCEDRFFSVAPFFHCSGLMHALLTCFIHGASLHAMSRYTPETCLEEIATAGVTLSHGPLPKSLPPALRPTSPTTFTRAWAGGSANDLLELEENLGIRSCSLWGMTETCGCFAVTVATDPTEVRHRTAGRPLPGLEFRIVDDQGVTVTEVGGRGELRIRGWNLTPGYFRDPDATAAAFDSEGWFRTGDLAEHAGQGRFRYVGRIKDTLRVGGENVAPEEIEAILLGADGVADAAVVGMPHPRLGQVPVAVLVPAPNARLSAEILQDHSRGLLANFKVPCDFYTIEELPRTHATNRIQRQALRAAIDAGLVQHVS